MDQTSEETARMEYGPQVGELIYEEKQLLQFYWNEGGNNWFGFQCMKEKVDTSINFNDFFSSCR